GIGDEMKNLDLEGAEIQSLAGKIDAKSVDMLDVGKFETGASLKAKSIKNAMLPGSAFVITNSMLMIDGAMLETDAGAFENLTLQGQNTMSSLIVLAVLGNIATRNLWQI